MPNTLEISVAAHYGVDGLIDAINAGLDAAGADTKQPTIEALAPVDEFHTVGRVGTVEALSMMALKPGMHVLDAGCGIGGTARCLAAERGCTVAGIDLTAGFVEVAKDLTARTGLSGKCAFEVGSVLDMPFAEDCFDAALTFHVAMNIEDRAGFYDEVFRVLRPGSEFCVFDVMKGPTPGMNYPTPWAETAETSFLKSRDETAVLLEGAGFAITGERNLRDVANDYYARAMEKAAKAGGPPPVGLHLLTGANTEAKFANIIEAYQSHRTEPVILIARKN